MLDTKRLPMPLRRETGLLFSTPLVVAIIGAALSAPTARGQSHTPPDGDQERRPATPDENAKATDDAREQLTAADVLRALRRQRPENKIIAPTGRGPNWDAAPKDILFPEGFALVNQSGRLSQEGDWWVFQFAKDSGINPMKLLPTANAEPMIRSVAQSSAAYAFKVSGETTVFDGENFLLLHLALLESAAAPTATGADNARPVDAQPNVPDTDAPGTEGAPPAPPAADGDVDDVMAALQAQKPSGEPITFTATTSALEPVGADQSRPALLPEGAAIIDRPARLVQSGTWWTLVFESDSAGNPEPPIKLLPNSNLQTMTAAAKEEPNGLVFVVSGQVTVYDGENYLLARAVRRRVAGGNLRK